MDLVLKVKVNGVTYGNYQFDELSSAFLTMRDLVQNNTLSVNDVIEFYAVVIEV